MNKLIKSAKKGLSLRLFLKQERSKSIGLQNSIKSLFKGFFSVSETIYNFPVNNHKEYLSDWARIYKASNINGHQKIILDDKILFHSVESNNSTVLPLLYFIRKKKIWKNSHGTYEAISLETFLEEVKQYANGLIIKPSTGGGGNGISKVILMNGEIIFNGDCRSQEDFVRILKSEQDFVVTEVLRQTGKLSEIYPHSTNSTRILVMRDPKTGIPFISRAVQRIGTRKSGIVDNWSAGGISIDVDVSTGIMGRGASFTKDSSLDWRRTHPDTDAEFYGVKIPDWERIAENVIQLSEKYFFLSYIGWDIVPMKEGFYILEGNTNSDVNLLQIHKGLLKDPEVRRFYSFYNVI